jgi:DNA-binding IscR family transcriptional regulator
MVTKDRAKEAMNYLSDHTTGCPDPKCNVCRRMAEAKRDLEEFIDQTSTLDMSDTTR